MNVFYGINKEDNIMDGCPYFDWYHFGEQEGLGYCTIEDNYVDCNGVIYKCECNNKRILREDT